jgi:hypothetical protein
MPYQQSFRVTSQPAALAVLDDLTALASLDVLPVLRGAFAVLGVLATLVDLAILTVLPALKGLLQILLFWRFRLFFQVWEGSCCYGRIGYFGCFSRFEGMLLLFWLSCVLSDTEVQPLFTGRPISVMWLEDVRLEWCKILYLLWSLETQLLLSFFPALRGLWLFWLFFQFWGGSGCLANLAILAILPSLREALSITREAILAKKLLFSEFWGEEEEITSFQPHQAD